MIGRRSLQAGSSASAGIGLGPVSKRPARKVAGADTAPPSASEYRLPRWPLLIAKIDSISCSRVIVKPSSTTSQAASSVGAAGGQAESRASAGVGHGGATSSVCRSVTAMSAPWATSRADWPTRSTPTTSP